MNSLFPPLLLNPLIHHTFGPLADRAQRMAVVRMSYAPWRYRRGPAIEHLRTALQERFGMHAALFSAGREGLLAFLRSIRTGDHDEVIVQGYTCIVVPNAIHAAGMKTVYADIDPQTLTPEIDDVARRITSATRAIIVQHTFGIPADTQRLRALCDAHNILLIEDCAHILPDGHGPAVIGVHADAMLLSFGRDKAISGIAGGAMLYRDDALRTAMQHEEDHAADLPRTTVRRLLEYPQLYGIARPLYGLGIGKVILRLAQALGLLVPILTPEERRGNMPPVVHRIPNLCAALALQQLKNLQNINDHRRMLTRFYLQACKDRGWRVIDGITPDLPLQKFPLFLRDADAVRTTLKTSNIHLDDGWTGCVVCPRTADASAAGYAAGCDPRAEAASSAILTLPTHPGTSQADAEALLTALSPLLRQ